MGEEFVVAFGAGNRRGKDSTELPGSLGFDKGADFFHGGKLESFVTNDSTATYLIAGEFELGFYEHDDIGLGRENGKDRRKNQGQGNEAHVSHGEVNGRRKVAGLEEAGIDSFVNNHAGILADAPMELGMPDIEGMDTGRAALKQAVGESSGGGTNVETNFVARIKGEAIQSGLQLETAATDITFGLPELNRGIPADFAAGFASWLPGDFHFPGHDEALGLLAGIGQTTFDQKLIKPDFFRVVGVDDLLHILGLPKNLCSPNLNSSRDSNK